MVYLIKLNSSFKNHFNTCVGKGKQSRNFSTTRNSRNCRSTRTSRTWSRSLPGSVCQSLINSDQNLIGSQLGHEKQSLRPKYIKENPPKPGPQKKEHYCQCLKEIALFRIYGDTCLLQLCLWVEGRERVEQFNDRPFLTTSLSFKCLRQEFNHLYGSK